MKTNLCLALVAGAMIAGCGTPSGTDRAAAAAESMAEFRKDVSDGQKQLDVMIAAMNGLSSAKGDLKGPYDKFVDEWSRTEKHAAALRAEADEMKARGREFFKKWEEEVNKINNEELRAKAKARASERSKEYANIEAVMGTVKGKWTALQAEISDVKQYLSNDLTPKGVASLSDTFTKANLDSTDLKKALGDVNASLEKVQADFSAKAADQPKK